MHLVKKSMSILNKLKSVMNDFTISVLAVPFGYPKNLQKVNTIEIRYKMTVHNHFLITYKFHKIDYFLWKEDLIRWHTLDLNNNYEIWDEGPNVVDLDNFENSDKFKETPFFHFALATYDAQVYRNMWFVPYLINKKTNWDNLDAQLYLNFYID